MEIPHYEVALPAVGETHSVFVRATTEDERQFFKGASRRIGMTQMENASTFALDLQ